MKELDELGLRYNNPYTGRYFDLPLNEPLNIDIGTLWWDIAPALMERLQKECGVMP